MKFQILIFILSISYVFMTLTFSSNPTGTCSNNIYTLTISGTTDAAISSAQAAELAVTFSPNTITATCTTSEVTAETISTGGNSATVSISCSISQTLTSQTIGITKITISDSHVADSLTLSVSGVTCGTSQQQDTSITIGAIKLKASSVSAKNVVVSITPETEADKTKQLTAAATINNLKLVDSSSFSEDLTCSLASGSKLSSVTCTMTTAATTGTKYKLSGTSVTITSSGSDTFGTITVEDDQVTATEASNNNSNNNNSGCSYLNYSGILASIFALVF